MARSASPHCPRSPRRTPRTPSRSGSALPVALVDGFQSAFLVGAIVAALGVVAALTLIRRDELEVEVVPEPAVGAGARRRLSGRCDRRAWGGSWWTRPTSSRFRSTAATMTASMRPVGQDAAGADDRSGAAADRVARLRAARRRGPDDLLRDHVGAAGDHRLVGPTPSARARPRPGPRTPYRRCSRPGCRGRWCSTRCGSGRAR